MATVFETRLIGNIGRDAILKHMERGMIAINFPVAHNRNWRDKRTGESKTSTTWVNCTIWKKDGDNLRVVDFLKKGALVSLEGTPVAKGYSQEDGSVRTELRLNISKTNILRAAKFEEESSNDLMDKENYHEDFESTLDDFTIDEEDF
jgi:single-strand DNA-binding protein